MPFSSKTDIWSLGVMIYQMLYGKTPWVGDTPGELLRNICNIPLKFPKKSKVSKEFLELLRKMLIIDENQRISWTSIFEDSLINLKPVEIKTDLNGISHLDSTQNNNSNVQLNSISESAELGIERKFKQGKEEKKLCQKKEQSGLFGLIRRFFCCI